MFNRSVWFFTVLFWIAVIAVAGWCGVVIVGVFSVCIMVVVLLTERGIRHD